MPSALSRFTGYRARGSAAADAARAPLRCPFLLRLSWCYPWPRAGSRPACRALRPFDEATCRAYLDAAVAFARDCRPPYLGLGVEVNILAEKSPADFERFVRLHDEVYDAVKAVSPKTKVFTVFQLEKMKGLGGGLFGGTNDPARAQWRLLSRFARLDLAAFTTYPGLVFKAPGDVPADYYS